MHADAVEWGRLPGQFFSTLFAGVGPVIEVRRIAIEGPDTSEKGGEKQSFAGALGPTFRDLEVGGLVLF